MLFRYVITLENGIETGTVCGEDWAAAMEYLMNEFDLQGMEKVTLIYFPDGIMKDPKPSAE